MVQIQTDHLKNRGSSPVKENLLEASSELLDWSSRKHPDLFIAAESTLRPLIDKHNHLFSLWLRSGHQGDRQRYLTQRQCVLATVRTCKNQWFQEMANSVQFALAQGTPSVMWCDIKAFCQCRAGLQPVQLRTI